MILTNGLIPLQIVQGKVAEQEEVIDIAGIVANAGA